MTPRYKGLAAGKVEDLIHKDVGIHFYHCCFIIDRFDKGMQATDLVNDDYMLRFAEYFSIPKPA